MVQHRIHHVKWSALTTGTYGGIYLGELIDVLAIENNTDPDRMVAGFCDPHSNRGVYANLGVSLANFDAPVCRLLSFFEGIVGQTFEGWKGGDWEMTRHVEVHISVWGDVGEPLTPLALRALLRRPLK